MDKKIYFQINPALDLDAIIALYRDSGLNRPINDPDRIAAIYKASNFVVSAHHQGALVGVCRALTDHQYVCYVADLAVAPAYQGQGVGSALVKHLAATQGEKVSLVLLSAPGAMTFYPKLDFVLADNCYIRRRST